MLCAIKHKHLASDRLGRNKVGVLGHVPRAVDLPFMVDLLDDLNAWAGRDSVGPELSGFVVVGVAGEVFGGVGAGRDGDRGDLEVVLRLAGGVSTEKEAVGYGTVLSGVAEIWLGQF